MAMQVSSAAPSLQDSEAWNLHLQPEEVSGPYQV